MPKSSETPASIDLDALTPDEREFLSLCSEATHVDVQSFSYTVREDFHPYSQLRGIIFNGQHYADRGAACACADIRLFKFSDTGYTVCHKHGVQELGHLRREYATGGKKGKK